MPAKKKTEDTNETVAIKTPRKRATKKAIESEIPANNDFVTTNEIVEGIETKEFDEVTNDKLIEIAETPTSVSAEATASDKLETIETTTDNQQTSVTDVTDLVGKDSENGSKKKWKKGEHSDDRVAKKDIDVQKKFYERLINDKVEVSIQLEKLKITGIITYEHPFYILVETKFGQQFIYKGSISYISAKKPFIKRPFIKRDRPFFNNRENTDNQVATGQEEPDSQPRFTKISKENQNPNITQTETNQSQQANEQPIRRPNEAKTFNRYQNQPPKNQSKPEPQKDAREVKVYKIVCAPPVKPKK